MTPELPLPYSPMWAFFKTTLFRVGLPVGLVLLLLTANWWYAPQRYEKRVGDEMDAIRRNSPGMKTEQERTEKERQRAR